MLPLSPWRGSTHARFTMWELTNAPARFEIGRANCSPVKEFAAVQVNISLDFDLSCPKDGSGVFLTVPAMLGFIFIRIMWHRSMVLVVVTKSMKTSSRVFTVWARTCRSLESLLRVVRRRCCYRTLCQTLSPALANLAELPFACRWTDPTSSKWRGLCGERALTYMGCFQVEAPVWQYIFWIHPSAGQNTPIPGTTAGGDSIISFRMLQRSPPPGQPFYLDHIHRFGVMRAGSRCPFLYSRRESPSGWIPHLSVVHLSRQWRKNSKGELHAGGRHSWQRRAWTWWLDLSRPQKQLHAANVTSRNFVQVLWQPLMKEIKFARFLLDDNSSAETFLPRHCWSRRFSGPEAALQQSFSTFLVPFFISIKVVRVGSRSSKGMGLLEPLVLSNWLPYAHWEWTNKEEQWLLLKAPPHQDLTFRMEVQICPSWGRMVGQWGGYLGHGQRSIWMAARLPCLLYQWIGGFVCGWLFLGPFRPQLAPPMHGGVSFSPLPSNW